MSQPQPNLTTGQFAGASTIPDPSLGLPPQQYQTSRGICTLDAPGVGTLQFRTNPNEITWDYELITHIEQTYGGRVVQILGTKMDNLTVKVDCGQGGWPYAMYIVQFMRDLMVTQRNGVPATFRYTTRGWQLAVFALNIPFHDEVNATIREMTLNFKIQQDISGLQTASNIAQALATLVEGIGFTPNQYNTNGLDPNSFIGTDNPNPAVGGGGATTLESSLPIVAATAATGPIAAGIPGLDSVTSLFGGFLGGI